jgi:hypothetical protein
VSARGNAAPHCYQDYVSVENMAQYRPRTAGVDVPTDACYPNLARRMR